MFVYTIQLSKKEGREGVGEEWGNLIFLEADFHESPVLLLEDPQARLHHPKAGVQAAPALRVREVPDHPVQKVRDPKR